MSRSIDVDLTFPHRFQLDVLDELPGGPAQLRRYVASGHSGQDGVLVHVQPMAGNGWLGMFAFGKFGKDGITRVASMPNPEELCVVAKGAGYVVKAIELDRWEVVKAAPIVDMRAIPTVGLVVFANFTELVAYGENGIRWRTKRLAWDGLRILAIGDRLLVGEYWDMRDEAMQRFEVDLDTGIAVGGVEI